jgi:hypothetical protein
MRQAGIHILWMPAFIMVKYITLKERFKDFPSPKPFFFMVSNSKDINPVAEP